MEELTEAQLTNFTQRMASLEVPVIQLEMPPHQARGRMSSTCSDSGCVPDMLPQYLNGEYHMPEYREVNCDHDDPGYEPLPMTPQVQSHTT